MKSSDGKDVSHSFRPAIEVDKPCGVGGYNSYVNCTIDRICKIADQLSMVELEGVNES
jgi:hypothetical protein